jgi:hypothetical protein
MSLTVTEVIYFKDFRGGEKLYHNCRSETDILYEQKVS